MVTNQAQRAISTPKNARLELWGNNIRSHRKALKKSQLELAEELGLKQQSVSYWEKGLTAPRDDHKLAVARALQTEVAYLFPLREAP